MKKILVFLPFLLAATMLLGQLSINPQIGINSSRLTSDPAGDGSSVEGRVGWQIGGDVRIGGRLHFMPGIYWIKNSSQITQVKDAGSAGQQVLTSDQAISSIAIPVQAGFTIINSSIVKLRLHAGPMVSWVTSVKDFTVIDSGGDPVAINKDDYASSIWAVRTGLGVQLLGITLDLGADWGLTNVFREDSEAAVLGGMTEAKSNVIYLNLGFNFGGGNN